ncbi:MAG: PCRF domain-containing protein, partial [Myxococcota bacterium]|nr:PCRF domain-containing protein [Myxococcota bacterium]
MFETLAEVEDHYEALEARLGDPEIAADPRRYAEVAKEHADLRDLVAVYREYRELGRSIASNRELLDDEDPEMREMARAEL